MNRAIKNLPACAAVTAALAFSTLNAHAQLGQIYIGIDSRPAFTSGAYNGQPNPNANRLTLLYAHGYKYVPGHAPAGESAFDNNHYHGIGVYSLTGPASAPVVTNSSSNNRLPEISTKQPPLTLVPGLGLYSNKLVNAKSAEHFSDPRWQSVWSLNQPAKYGPGSPEWIMFHSSGGTRTNSLAGSAVVLELVEKSEHLHIGTSNILEVLSAPGDRLSLGDGNLIDFTPVFWVENSAPPGRYSAAFKLVDTNASGRTPFGESGIFWLDFQAPAAPELDISSHVSVEVPLVAPGYILEGAASPEGPWMEIPLSSAKESGFKRAVELPGNTPMQVFRMRKP